MMNHNTSSSTNTIEKDWTFDIGLKEYNEANLQRIELLDSLLEFTTPKGLLKVDCLQFKHLDSGKVYLWTIQPSKVFPTLQNRVSIQTKSSAFDTRVLEFLKKHKLILPGCYTAHIIPLANIIEQEVELTAWLKKNTKTSSMLPFIHSFIYSFIPFTHFYRKYHECPCTLS
jgi:hypothetical protein